MLKKKLALALSLLAATSFASTASAYDISETLNLDSLLAIAPGVTTIAGQGIAGLTLPDGKSFNGILAAAANNNKTFDFKVTFDISPSYTADFNVLLLTAASTYTATSFTFNGVNAPYTVGFVQGAIDTLTLAPGLNTLELTGVIGPQGTTGITYNIGLSNIHPVPEPEQWAMLLLGLPLVGRFVNRKKAA